MASSSQGLLLRAPTAFRGLPAACDVVYEGNSQPRHGQSPLEGQRATIEYKEEEEECMFCCSVMAVVAVAAERLRRTSGVWDTGPPRDFPNRQPASNGIDAYSNRAACNNARLAD